MWLDISESSELPSYCSPVREVTLTLALNLRRDDQEFHLDHRILRPNRKAPLSFLSQIHHHAERVPYTAIDLCQAAHKVVQRHILVHPQDTLAALPEVHSPTFWFRVQRVLFVGGMAATP